MRGEIVQSFSLATETLGYVTSEDPSNTDFRFLVAGSKNVMINSQKKFFIRSGYTRLGVANAALNPVQNGWDWQTSTGARWSIRFTNGTIQAYLQTVDTTIINAWTTISSIFTTTGMLRSCILQGGNGGWFDSTEKIDLCLMVQGDSNIYEWNGAIAVVGSIPDGTHITKVGTTTWAQNRFYTTRNKVMVCVRTGTEYTYTAGESSTNLTVTDSTGLVTSDILVQKIVTTSNKPSSGYTNDIIYNFQNQIVIGSASDARTFGSLNTDFTTYSPSSPRVAGEGFTLTLDNPASGITSLGKTLLVGAGTSTIFQVLFTQEAIGAVAAETVQIQRLDVGVNQGFMNQETILPVTNEVFYLSNEVALRSITNPNNLVGLNPKTLSYPIKPDFDGENWTGHPFLTWYKNTIFISAPAASHMYMLNFVQDADGKLLRFWNPPQVLPVGTFAQIQIAGVTQLYGHSNVVPETYLLFDGQSDGQYAGMPVSAKLPIEARAVRAYNHYGKPGTLKNFDELFSVGDITPSTILQLIINYDFGGMTQMITENIIGSNEAILEGVIAINSLAQTSLAQNPLGGLLNPPSDARRYRIIFEEAKEDFFELQLEYYTNDVDQYWGVLEDGINVQISPRKSTNLKM